MSLIAAWERVVNVWDRFCFQLYYLLKSFFVGFGLSLLGWAIFILTKLYFPTKLYSYLAHNVWFFILLFLFCVIGVILLFFYLFKPIINRTFIWRVHIWSFFWGLLRFSPIVYGYYSHEIDSLFLDMFNTVYLSYNHLSGWLLLFVSIGIVLLVIVVALGMVIFHRTESRIWLGLKSINNIEYIISDKDWRFVELADIQTLIDASDVQRAISISILGSWWRGKTVFMRNLCARLEWKTEYIPIWIDTWRYDTIWQLLQIFYAKLKNVLRKYSLFLPTEISSYINAVISVYRSEATGLLAWWGKKTIDLHNEEFKKQIWYILWSKKIVIFVDDMDRILQRSHVEDTLKFINYFADLPNFFIITGVDREKILQQLDVKDPIYLNKFFDLNFELAHHSKSTIYDTLKDEFKNLVASNPNLIQLDNFIHALILNNSSFFDAFSDIRQLKAFSNDLEYQFKSLSEYIDKDIRYSDIFALSAIKVINYTIYSDLITNKEITNKIDKFAEIPPLDTWLIPSFDKRMNGLKRNLHNKPFFDNFSESEKSILIFLLQDKNKEIARLIKWDFTKVSESLSTRPIKLGLNSHGELIRWNNLYIKTMYQQKAFWQGYLSLKTTSDIKNNLHWDSSILDLIKTWDRGSVLLDNNKFDDLEAKMICIQLIKGIQLFNSDYTDLALYLLKVSDFAALYSYDNLDPDFFSQQMWDYSLSAFSAYPLLVSELLAIWLKTKVFNRITAYYWSWSTDLLWKILQLNSWPIGTIKGNLTVRKSIIDILKSQYFFDYVELLFIGSPPVFPQNNISNLYRPREFIVPWQWRVWNLDKYAGFMILNKILTVASNFRVNNEIVSTYKKIILIFPLSLSLDLMYGFISQFVLFPSMLSVEELKDRVIRSTKNLSGSGNHLKKLFEVLIKDDKFSKEMLTVVFRWVPTPISIKQLYEILFSKKH